MTAMAVTSNEVRALTSHGAVVIPGIAGATVTIGYLVYQAADGDWEHADANSAGLEGVLGVAVESYDGEDTVAAGNALSVCMQGPVSGYDALTAGAVYYLSDTVGRLDDAAGTFDRLVGRGVELAGEVVLWVDVTLSDEASA
jgi:hypothetical protein